MKLASKEADRYISQLGPLEFKIFKMLSADPARTLELMSPCLIVLGMCCNKISSILRSSLRSHYHKQCLQIADLKEFRKSNYLCAIICS